MMRAVVILCAFMSTLSAQRDDIGSGASLTIIISSETPDRIAVGNASYPLDSAQEWLESKAGDLESGDSILILCDPSIPIGTIIQAENLAKAIHPRVFVVCRNAKAPEPFILLATQAFKTDAAIRQLVFPQRFYIDTVQPPYQSPMGDSKGLYVEPPQDLIDRLKSQE